MPSRIVRCLLVALATGTPLPALAGQVAPTQGRGILLPTGDAAALQTDGPSWKPDAVAVTSYREIDRPVDGGRLSSTFGVRHDPIDGTARAHRGIDIAGPYGTPIRAAADGVVAFAGMAGGYGQLIRIDHGAGVETRYGHLSRFLVIPGTRVRRGDTIGAMGSTGRSTGSHVHFEVRQDGIAVDPTAPLAADPTVAWGVVSPLPPVVPHWTGWRVEEKRLPSAF